MENIVMIMLIILIGITSAYMLVRGYCDCRIKYNKLKKIKQKNKTRIE